jgi:hypothetical protein
VFEPSAYTQTFGLSTNACYVTTPHQGAPCPAGYTGTVGLGLCYRMRGVAYDPHPADCLPGETREREGCIYDPSAGASAGCLPGEYRPNAPAH